MSDTTRTSPDYGTAGQRDLRDEIAEMIAEARMYDDCEQMEWMGSEKWADEVLALVGRRSSTLACRVEQVLAYAPLRGEQIAALAEAVEFLRGTNGGATVGNFIVDTSKIPVGPCASHPPGVKCMACDYIEGEPTRVFDDGMPPVLTNTPRIAPDNAAGGQHSNVPLTNSVKRIYRELEALSDEEVTNSMCEHMPWPRVDSFGEPAGDAETAEMVRGVFESLLHKLHHRIADSQPAAFETTGQTPVESGPTVAPSEPEDDAKWKAFRESDTYEWLYTQLMIFAANVRSLVNPGHTRLSQEAERKARHLAYVIHRGPQPLRGAEEPRVTLESSQQRALMIRALNAFRKADGNDCICGYDEAGCRFCSGFMSLGYALSALAKTMGVEVEEDELESGQQNDAAQPDEERDELRRLALVDNARLRLELSLRTIPESPIRQTWWQEVHDAAHALLNSLAAQSVLARLAGGQQGVSLERVEDIRLKGARLEILADLFGREPTMENEKQLRLARQDFIDACNAVAACLSVNGHGDTKR